MISDIIVWATVGFTLAFVGAWAWSPGLRARIEQPKHRFLDAVRAFDTRGGSASPRPGART